MCTQNIPDIHIPNIYAFSIYSGVLSRCLQMYVCRYAHTHIHAHTHTHVAHAHTHMHTDHKGQELKDLLSLLLRGVIRGRRLQDFLRKSLRNDQDLMTTRMKTYQNRLILNEKRLQLYQKET